MTTYLDPDPGALPTTNLPVPGRALAIGAHPDDIEFGCGATLAKWAAQGCAAFGLVLTDGSKGTWDPAADPADLVELREREARDAFERLGGRELRLSGFVDGELDSGLAEREVVCAVIRELRPDVVLSHDPWKMYRLHPDHAHAGQLAVAGVVAARDPKFFPHHPHPPHRPSHLLLWEAQLVDHLEDVEGTLADKVAALLCHGSQWESTMGIGSDTAAGRGQFESRLAERAAAAGRPAGLAYAEAFKRIDRL